MTQVTLDEAPELIRLRRRVVELEEELAEAYRQADATVDDDLSCQLQMRFGFTPAEARMVAAMLRRPGHVIRRAALLACSCMDWPDRDDHQVAVQICRARRSLRAAGLDDTISTVWGRGYVIEPDQARRILAEAAP